MHMTKKLAHENIAPFTSCISKVNNFLVDVADDLYVVMLLYSLLQHGKNYRKTSGSLWNYYSGAVGNINYSIKDSKSFDYKTSIIVKLEGNNVEKDDIEIAVP